MLNQDQIQAIKAPFPPEALSADTSRGFELTSIKAAFVIERLNEIFGPCGTGWRYVHSPFEVFTNNGKTEIVTEVAFQYRFHATNDCVGCDQVCRTPRPTLGPSVTVARTTTGASPSSPVVASRQSRSASPMGRPRPLR